MLQQILDTSEFGNQLLCSLFPYTGATGNIVRRVTHQPQHINHLRRRLDIKLGFPLLDAHHLKTTCMLGTVHEYLVAHQLTVVLVRRHHIRRNPLLAGFGGKSSYHVVGFVARHFENRNTISPYNILYNRYGQADCFGSLFALRFILFESLVAEGRP